MAEVKVLIEGYAKQLKRGWIASSTTCLVTSNGKRIITDPGCNRKLLMSALKKERLNTGDIDFVFLSHAHQDHVLLAGLFENARFVTFDTNLMYDKDLMLEFGKHVLGRDVEIVDTPGHMLEHLSLVVKTKKGNIAIAGDAIWWISGERQVFRMDQPDHSQAKGMDMRALIRSRKKLISMSDYVIPGHGMMFKVKRKCNRYI